MSKAKKDEGMWESQIEKDTEEQTRVEMKPVPPSQLDRIERKLDWLIIKSQLDYFANIGIHAPQEQRNRCAKNIKRLKKQLPDLSDIGLKEKK